MPRLLVIVPFAALCNALIFIQLCPAGTNATATARLSWQSAQLIESLPEVATTGSPLYLHIQNATDMRRLEASITWTAGSDSLCYSIVPDDNLPTTCGATSQLDDFSEPDFRIAITFSPEVITKSCVSYRVIPTGCGNIPARFCLAQVVVTDTQGARDTLQVTGGVQIGVGVEQLCAPTINSVSPITLRSGVPEAISVHGSGFSPDAQVALLSGDVTVVPDSIAFHGEGHLTAYFLIPDVPRPPSASRVGSDGEITFDLRVGTIDHGSTTASEVLAVSNACLARILNVTTEEIHGIQGTPGPTAGVAHSMRAPGIYDARLGGINPPPPGPVRCNACYVNCVPGLIQTMGRCKVTIDLGCVGDLYFTNFMQTSSYGGWYIGQADGYDNPPPPGEHRYFYYKELGDRACVSTLCYGQIKVAGPVENSVPLQYYRNLGATQVTMLFTTLISDACPDYYPGLWNIENIRIAGCPIATLTPLQGADLALEAGVIDTVDLHVDTRNALACYRAAVSAAGGTLKMTSGYRSPTYQEHLRAVWLKWQELKHNKAIDCQTLRGQVRDEFAFHGLGASQIAPARGVGERASHHVTGYAFDATVGGLTSYDTIAGTCGLRRPYGVRDSVHFEVVR